MEITAQIKYLKISSKKMKTLGRIVVGLNPTDAMDRLLMLSGKAPRLLFAAIKSAQADAQNNLKLDISTLKIKTVEVLKGPTMKRWQPVSRGMAHQIKKRMTHVKVILVPKEIKQLPKAENLKKGKN